MFSLIPLTPLPLHAHIELGSLIQKTKSRWKYNFLVDHNDGNHLLPLCHQIILVFFIGFVYSLVNFVVFRRVIIEENQTIRCLDIKKSFPRHLTSSAHAVGLKEKIYLHAVNVILLYSEVGAEYLIWFKQDFERLQRRK